MENIKYSSVILALIFFSSIIHANGVIEQGNTAYMSNTVVVKYKSTSSAGLNKQAGISPSVVNVMEPYGLKSAKQLLFAETKYKSTLNNIVVIEYFSDIDPVQLSEKLKELDDVEWAEPKFLRQVSYVPNDTSISNQYALSKISAAAAWDISKGDSTVIIGIVDTGVDWDHPDLYANIWVNEDEIPGDGIDNDNNGYVDDIRGWDFGGLTGTPDNNPMEDGSYHGTHVAGLASAVTDNSTGIASIGFNCTIMPVKAAQDNLKNSSGQPYISYGDEGIVYAVDNGARIINCSYGGSGYSILDQELVNYAVENNVLIVAAAGNDNSSNAHYPSAYNGVLSVAATDINDKRSSFSNYGPTVDVSSPGSGVYGTWQNDRYAYLSGTSMASPITAGLAGLVASHYPSYTPGQIAEQIRVNADDIDGLNTAYTKMLGKGRINAYKALNNSNSVAVRAIEYVYTDETPGGNGNGILEAGETIRIAVKFINYLNPISSLSITLSSMNVNAVIQDGTFSPGAAATLESFDNNSAKYTVSLPASLAQDAELSFSLNYSDGTYTDFQLFGTTANPTFGTQSGNNIAVTITSRGTIGYNDYPENLQGNGFHYLDGGNILFEGALILGNSASKISDAARNSEGNARNNDFSIVEPFVLSVPGKVADQQGQTIFNDNGAGSKKYGITITLQSYSYNTPSNLDYILLSYSFKNDSDSLINNLYAGLFFDWDLKEGDGGNDITAFDDEGKFGYVYHAGGDPDNYAGAALVSSDQYGFFGILNDGSDSGFSIYDGFSDAEKWEAISGGISKTSAGSGDISHVISGGPFSIPAGESHNLTFAIAAAPDLEELRTAITNSKKLLEGTISVELVSFSGTYHDSCVNLYWETATETNNSGFEIQRTIAPDESNWERIGFVPGKGTTSTRNSYRFIDTFYANIASVYYRLKQVDFDGSIGYSDIIEISMVPLLYSLKQNYPNPFNPATTIQFSLAERGQVTLKIYDILGKEVISLVNEEKEAGEYKISFNASGFASGVYFYELKSGSFSQSKKMLLIK